MGTTPGSRSIGYRVGDVTIDLARRQVSRNGKEIELGKLSYDLLLALAESAPQVVSPDELVARVWNGRFVNPPTLKQRINLLRQALGDDASEPRYVRVVRGHGYALVPDVKPVYRRANRRPTTSAGVVAALIAIVAIGAAMLSKFSTSTPAGPVSLGVLPFENLSPEPDNAFFANGLHQELLDRLGEIRGLNVISRSSVKRFAESDDPVTELAREFNVDAVMEGSVNYQEGRVRISARLVDPESGARIWSKSFDRAFSDIFEIQREIAVAVSGALGITLGVGEHGAYTGAGTRSMEAYEAYLAGLDMMQQPQGQGRASFFFKRATEIDPDYAAAWAQLGFTAIIRSYFAPPERAREVLDEALPYLQRASELDPRSARVAATLGFAHYSLYDWIGAEDHFARAIEMDPDRFSLNQHASLLVRAGRITEAKSEFDAAGSVQDADFTPGQLRRHVSIIQKDFDESRRLVAMDEVALRRQHLLLGIALNEGKPDIIKSAISELIAVHGEVSPLFSPILDEFDSVDRALEIIEAAYNDINNQWPSKHFDIAMLAAYFGDPELALDSISRDVRLTTVRIWVLWYPIMSDVRRLPGFKELVKDLNLVDYWRIYGWPDTCAPQGEGDFRCW